MVFSSNLFLFFFLPVTIALYYCCPKRYRNLLLLLVSLFFYAWGEPVYLWLMVFTIAHNYLGGRLISKQRREGNSPKPILIISIVLNLLLLAYFKYASLIVETVNLLPLAHKLTVPDIPLPIGISFYIFQSMSYIIDVYRGRAEEQRSPVAFGAYVALFPQLIAGPIVRYSDVAKQLEQRKESLSQFSGGIALFIVGLAKKMLLANKMGALWATLIPAEGMFSAWVGMLAYTLQIYFDFSGYSDMAIGLGRMFGFEFLPNFNYPYISKSITEFWRRWHISLSTWFREYLYIPLGGNRSGKARQLLNIFIVWALTGLWHGASWNFLLWGVYYAIWLTLEKLFLSRAVECLPGILRMLSVFTVVAFGWMLFYFTDTGELFAFLSRLFSFRSDSVYALNSILAYAPLISLSILAATPLPLRLFHRFDGRPGQTAVGGVWLALLLLLCVAALASQSYNPFIYFRF